MRPSDKSKDYTLLGCNTIECPILMFVASPHSLNKDNCPVCYQPGVFIRGPIEDSFIERRDQIRRELGTGQVEFERPAFAPTREELP